MITRTIRSFLPVAALAFTTLAFAQATPAAKPAAAPVALISRQAFTGEHVGVAGDQAQAVNQSVHA
jgi:hypothetical protein